MNYCRKCGRSEINNFDLGDKRHDRCRMSLWVRGIRFIVNKLQALL